MALDNDIQSSRSQFLIDTEGSCDMKIKVSCGGFELEYSGDEQFAKESLCSLVSEIKDIIQTDDEMPKQEQTYQNMPSENMKLPKFLAEMEKNSERNSREYRKFLVTAAWLHLNGKSKLQTADVASALLESKINKLSNPSDSLAKNIKYGHCERVENSGFIVTQRGFQDLELHMPE